MCYKCYNYPVTVITVITIERFINRTGLYKLTKTKEEEDLITPQPFTLYKMKINKKQKINKHIKGRQMGYAYEDAVCPKCKNWLTYFGNVWVCSNCQMKEEKKFEYNLNEIQLKDA
jgi:hypothetical protein